MLAQYIHQQSRRANGPFVAINCAAIPENMLEATLFGHEKGSFTGAYQSSPGKFEQAEGGTILLDEISEMDIGLQAKILRILQEREVERLGSRKTLQLDVRVIATTNRDLRACVREGRFREDLFYRLSVFPLAWQPLRHRRQDIVPLAERLLQQHAGRMGRGVTTLDARAQQALISHDWPGNVRELDNVLQRALIIQDGNVISAASLALVADTQAGAPAFVDTTLTEPWQVSSAASPEMTETDNQVLDKDLRQREFEIILQTLKKQRGRRKETAEALGVSARTLRYKLARMRDLGINIDSLVSA